MPVDQTGFDIDLPDVMVHDGHKPVGQQKQVGLDYLEETVSEYPVADTPLDEAVGHALVDQNTGIVLVVVVAVVAVLAVGGRNISVVMVEHWEAQRDLLT
jgi:hypothetical protein